MKKLLFEKQSEFLDYMLSMYPLIKQPYSVNWRVGHVWFSQEHFDGESYVQKAKEAMSDADIIAKYQFHLRSEDVSGENFYFLYVSYQFFLLLAQTEPIGSVKTVRSVVREILSAYIHFFHVERLVSPDVCQSCMYDACVHVCYRIQMEVVRFLSLVLHLSNAINGNVDVIEALFDLFSEEYVFVPGKSDLPRIIRQGDRHYKVRLGILSSNYVAFLQKSGLMPAGTLEYVPHTNKVIKEYFNYKNRSITI